MKKDKKTSSNIIFTIILFTIFSGIYLLYNHLTKKNLDIFDAVPTSTSFFIDFYSISNIWEKLNSNEMWNELKNIDGLKSIESYYQVFDSIAHLYPQFEKFITKGNGLLSIHNIENKNEILLVLKTGHHLNYSTADDLFEKIFKNNFARIQSKFQGEKIKKIIFDTIEQSFSYAFVENIFLCSAHEDLVKETIDHIQRRKSIKNDPDFEFINKSAGKKVDGIIYINYKNMPFFLDKLLAKDYTNFANNTTRYLAWTGLDLMIKNDELLLNGYSSIIDTNNYLLNSYQNQQAQNITLTGILPYNVNLMLQFGFENYQIYFNDYKNYLKKLNELNTFNDKINQLNISLKTNLEHIIIPEIGNEIALVSYANKPSEFSNKTYAIIKIKDVQKSRLIWDQIHKNVKGSEANKLYKEFEIYNINKDNILEVLLGEPFSPIKKFYYIFLNGFMIIANSNNSIESFIDFYKSGKTLDLNQNYKSFIDNIYQKSNLYLYCNIRNGFNLLNKFLSPELFSYSESQNLDFNNFQALGFQIANIQDNLLTNIYLKYNSGIIEENRSDWKANLDANIKGQPYIVKNHRENINNIVVFDVDNNMYLFDSKGTRLWKKQISEDIQSSIYLVDFYLNRKYQYLFSTKNYLHLIDLLGRYVEGYPKKLNSQATNELTVLDYENTKNYRLLIAGSDKKIYNYNIKGNEVKGWKKIQSLNIVNTKLQHLIYDKKDYIFVTDKEGIVKILNRVGDERIILKKQFGKSLQSDFYLNRTNQKGIFLTTNQIGKLQYISGDGSISETEFDNFTNEHYFLYEDFDKDGHQDFIFLDHNKLTIYDRFKKPIFTFEFKNNINQKPIFYNISSTQSILGIVSSESQEVFLFDKTGRVLISKGLIGETPFTIESLKNDNKLNLIVGTGSSLYNYVIK